MDDEWSLVLLDGSRHAVTGDIQFETRGRTGLVKRCAIQCDSETALMDAFADRSATLLSPHGDEYRVTVSQADGRWMVEGVS